MSEAGIGSVEIMATFYVNNSVNSTKIFAVPGGTPNDADIMAAIRDARRANLSVVLKPHIDCLDGIWRANIGTQFTSEVQWADWFSNYTDFVLHFASIAMAAGGVDGFNVGTELDGTFHRETEWRSVISAVRSSLQRTPLMLGPNWDWNHRPGYELVEFWDALDYLGVDMYAPLCSHIDCNISEAVAGWSAIVANLSAFSAAHNNKSVIFAEIGYASWEFAAINAPGCCSGPPDPSTQAILYESFFEAVYPQPWLAGVFWWSWLGGSIKPLPCSTDFSILGKPALDVLKSHYQSSGARTAQALVIYSGDSPTAPTTWDDYSYGVKSDLRSTVDPYPQHAVSIRVTSLQTYGAFALHAPAPINISLFSYLQLDVSAPNKSASYSLAVFLCWADDCNGSDSGPAADLDEYVSGCQVPSGWDANPLGARLRVPLTDLLPVDGRTDVMLHRVQVRGGEGLTWGLDNIALT